MIGTCHPRPYGAAGRGATTPCRVTTGRGVGGVQVVGDRKTPVYEAGITSLTKDETTMLVHFSKEKAQQFALVRIQQPEGDQPSGTT
jgi:hypothetical protein